MSEMAGYYLGRPVQYMSIIVMVAMLFTAVISHVPHKPKPSKTPIKHSRYMFIS